MTETDGTLFIGAQSGGAAPQALVLKRANRHGLIAGATGTGKTVTLQVLAEGFSKAGVPVFLSDVKGDLSGIAMPGSATSKMHEAFQSRAADIGLGAKHIFRPRRLSEFLPCREMVGMDMGIDHVVDLHSAFFGRAQIGLDLADGIDNRTGCLTAAAE